MKHFKNKKILVTGGAGFIGSHLTKRLVSVGAKVSVIVKYNSIIDCPRLLSIWDKIKVIEADLRNVDSVYAIKKLRFDYIFHFAAYNHVGDSFTHVSESINSNLFISGNIDLENIKVSFYEISDDKKFNTEDINFIESEFNDLMLEDGFDNMFNFQKLKTFLSSVITEKN